MTRYDDHRDLAFKCIREIRDAQAAMLVEHLRGLALNSPYYQRVLASCDIESVSLDALPTTTKHDIEREPESFLAVARENLAETVTSSGTSGAPIDFHFTENDLLRLAYNERQALSICGIERSDTVLLTCTLDRCFIAGLAYYSGCRSIGATAIRSGANPMETHFGLIRRLSVNVIVGVPSFLLKLARFAESARVAPASLGVERLVCIGEPLRDARLERLPLCSELETAWNAKAFSTYASTEMTTAFCECREQSGGHLIPELGIVEILNEEGSVLPAGEIGEVTITPFHLEGMPLLRYRTGDMSFLIEEPCACGRNSPRVGPIVGRKHQMIKCKGTSFYPSAIGVVLDAFTSVLEYQVRVSRKDLSDEVTIALALSDESDLPRIDAALAAALRVRMKLIPEPLESLRKSVFPPTARKPLRLQMEEFDSQ